MENSVKRMINIIEENGKVSFKLEGRFIAEDVILICNTVILSAMNQIVNSYSKALGESVKEPVADAKLEEKVTELKGMLYDFYNVNASNLLSTFAPEIEARPDITTQAILKAENALIEEEYDNLKKEGKIVPLKAVPKPRNFEEAFKVEQDIKNAPTIS